MSRCKYAKDLSGGCLECTAYEFMHCEAQVFDVNDDGSTNIVKCEGDKWEWVKRNWKKIKEQEHVNTTDQEEMV